MRALTTVGIVAVVAVMICVLTVIYAWLTRYRSPESRQARFNRESRDLLLRMTQFVRDLVVEDGMVAVFNREAQRVEAQRLIDEYTEIQRRE